MVYYGNTVRALIKVGATTAELLPQQLGSAELTRHPLAWPWGALLPSHPSFFLGWDPWSSSWWKLQGAHTSGNATESPLAAKLERDF